LKRSRKPVVGNAVRSKGTAPYAAPTQKVRIVGGHKVRIIGGQWKRTPITVIDRPGLRPTPDRVRETLFNWIGPAVLGSKVLDLFAGTGALGFEAASRGAASVTLVERDARVIQGIQSLKDRLQADMIIVQHSDAQTALDQAQWQKQRFDLVLLDPPFGEGWHEKILLRLAAVLASTARIYIEAEAAIEGDQVQAWLPSHVLTSVRSDRAGQVYYHLFCVEQRHS
jgi:16S rRNA (guanine966-N2)-methyltransferase